MFYADRMQNVTIIQERNMCVGGYYVNTLVCKIGILHVCNGTRTFVITQYIHALWPIRVG